MDFIEIMAEGESAILLFNPLIFIRLIDQPSFYPTFHPTFYFLSSGTGSLLTLDQSSTCTETSRAFAAGTAVSQNAAEEQSFARIIGLTQHFTLRGPGAYFGD